MDLTHALRLTLSPPARTSFPSWVAEARPAACSGPRTKWWRAASGPSPPPPPASSPPRSSRPPAIWPSAMPCRIGTRWPGSWTATARSCWSHPPPCRRPWACRPTSWTRWPRKPSIWASPPSSSRPTAAASSPSKPLPTTNRSSPAPPPTSSPSPAWTPSACPWTPSMCIARSGSALCSMRRGARGEGRNLPISQSPNLPIPNP